MKFYILWGFLVFIIIVIAYKFIVGPEGLVDYLQVHREKARMVERIKDLRDENLTLKRKINKLETDPSEKERVLREKLKYIKDGEIHYHFVKEKK